MTIDTMRRRALRTTALVALSAIGASLALPAAAQAPGSAPRAVFQVSDADPQKWALVLNNVRNAAQDFGAANAELEIVAFGPGIGMLQSDSPVAARIAEALKSGVRVVACENTMRAFKLSRNDMLPDIGYVPAGVGEIIRKQREGWAYLRP